MADILHSDGEVVSPVKHGELQLGTSSGTSEIQDQIVYIWAEVRPSAPCPAVC